MPPESLKALNTSVKVAWMDTIVGEGGILHHYTSWSERSD